MQVFTKATKTTTTKTPNTHTYTQKPQKQKPKTGVTSISFNTLTSFHGSTDRSPWAQAALLKNGGVGKTTVLGNSWNEKDGSVGSATSEPVWLCGPWSKTQICWDTGGVVTKAWFLICFGQERLRKGSSVCLLSRSESISQ